MEKITGGDRKVLSALAAGRLLKRSGNGFAAGARKCTGTVQERLRAQDLIEPAGVHFRISGPGMAYLQRRSFPAEPNRLPAKAAEVRGGRDAAAIGARTVNRAENPLAWLHARGKITERQFEAGERLRSDFVKAGEQPRITMSWSAAPAERGRRGPPAGLLPGEKITAAKQRLEDALAAAGPGLADVLRRTVCLGEGMETAEKALGWPARSGRVVLTLALDRVASFYKI